MASSAFDSTFKDINANKHDVRCCDIYETRWKYLTDYNTRVHPYGSGPCRLLVPSVPCSAYEICFGKTFIPAFFCAFILK